MKLTSVIIEGMHNVQRKVYRFNNLNYLHGLNGAGKSTVLQAVQLALLGYIPGTSKTKEAIMHHSNTHTMAVTAVLDDAGTEVRITRSWTGTAPKINSSVTIVPAVYDIKSIVADLELPIFNFNEFLGMTANKLKDWFISFLPAVHSSVNWETKLTEAIEGLDIADTELLPSIIDYTDKLNVYGIDAVRDVHLHLKTLLSAKDAELKRIQHTIQSLIFYEDDAIANLSVEDLESQIRKLTAQKSTMLEQAATIDLKNRLSTQLALLMVTGSKYSDDLEYTSAAARCTELDSHIYSISSERLSLVEEQAKLRASRDIQLRIVDSKGKCPFTSEICQAISNSIDTCNSEIATLGAKISEIDCKIHELDADQQRSEAERRECNNTMQSVIDKYNRFHNLQDQLAALPSIICEASSEDMQRIDAKINETSDQLAKVKANIQYNKLISSLTADKYKLEQSIIALRAWIKLTNENGLQTELMVAPFKLLAKEMDTYVSKLFGADITTKFFLSTKANSFSFGITKANKYIPFDLLSSGEKCMYTLALMMSIISHADSPLKLIMIDDLLDHLDDTNIQKLFESLYDVHDIQLLFAGVKPCAADDIVIEVV